MFPYHVVGTRRDNPDVTPLTPLEGVLQVTFPCISQGKGWLDAKIIFLLMVKDETEGLMLHILVREMRSLL